MVKTLVLMYFDSPSLGHTIKTQTVDMLNFNFFEKDLGVVSDS